MPNNASKKLTQCASVLIILISLNVILITLPPPILPRKQTMYGTVALLERLLDP